MSREMAVSSGTRHRDRESGGRLGSVVQRGDLWLALLFTVVLLLQGLYFARIQNIWIDESTQLSGARLAGRELLAWLAGSDAFRFGVPPDRMPPISYLLDSACAHSACAAPHDFRLLHLAIAASGVFVLLNLVAKRYGLLAGAVAGVLLVISPRLVDTSVEIRAYPILFTITCFQLRSFYNLVDRRDWRWLDVVPFFLLGLLSIYTHFFGLVSTMALVAGLLVCRVQTRRDFLQLTAIAAGLLICSVGLYPFVTSAASISGGEPIPRGLGPVASLLPRVLGHPADMVSTAGAVLMFGSLAVLVAIALGKVAVQLYRAPSSRFSNPLAGIAIGWLSGLAVTLLASRVVHGFDALKPSYSGWMLPFVALLASAAIAQAGRWKWPASALLLGGCLWGDYLFLTNAQFFVHGPEHAVNDAIGPNPSSSAIVYVGPDWAYSFFPIWYEHGSQVSQWALNDDGSLHRIGKGGAVGAASTPFTELAGSRKIILVDIEPRSFKSLRDHNAGQPVDVSRPEAVVSQHLPAMRLVSEYDRPGLYWSKMAVFRNSK